MPSFGLSVWVGRCVGGVSRGDVSRYESSASNDPMLVFLMCVSEEEEEADTGRLGIGDHEAPLTPPSLSPRMSHTGCEIKACYYRNDSPFRRTPNNITPEMIDTKLCTHLIYAFAHIKNGVLAPSLSTDEDSPWTEGIYRRFNRIKEKSPHIITLLSVGGWDFGSKKISEAAILERSRKKFIYHAIGFLRERNFDGLDLYWEYPGFRGGAEYTDKFDFTFLIQDLREAFEKESLITGKRRLILTAALAGDRQTYPVPYEISKFIKDLDFVSLITHDFNYNIEQCINTSPIYGDSPSDTRNIKYAVDYYLQMGIPRNKLIISVPMYGRAFFLSNSANSFYRAHTFGPYSESDIINDKDGLVAYFEVCRWQDIGLMIGRHQGFPYVSYGTLWASYEDTESIRYKPEQIREVLVYQ
ncbi:Endochitinase 1 [Bulinus truncatus]|nr:Endochitinase 1 [Bulinus truncatus]